MGQTEADAPAARDNSCLQIHRFTSAITTQPYIISSHRFVVITLRGVRVKRVGQAEYGCGVGFSCFANYVAPPIGARRQLVNFNCFRSKYVTSE